MKSHEANEEEGGAGMKTALTIAADSGPLLLERARDLALKATTVDEAKDIHDQLAAIAVYMRSRGASDETMKYANKAKLWTERRLGQLTKKMPKATKAEAQAIRESKQGRASITAIPAPTTKASALHEKGISKLQASRWEKLAEPNEAEFAAIVEKKVDASLRAAEKAADKGPAHVSHNSGEIEWYTPPEYIEAARRVMGGIDLDPASCETANKIVMADRFYSQQNDGLTKEWRGRVWMNPPYASRVVDAFAEKMAEEARAGHVIAACVLVNNATETGWFASLAGVASAVCFPSSRVKFLDRDGNPVGAPLQGQAVIYIGKSAKAFVREFSKLGMCWVKPE